LPLTANSLNSFIMPIGFSCYFEMLLMAQICSRQGRIMRFGRPCKESKRLCL